MSAPFEGGVGEPNTFGGYLVFLCAIAGGLFMKERWSNKKIALVLLIIFILPPLLYTKSRTSYLAAIPAIFTLALFSNKRFIAITLVVLGLILSPILLPSTVKERVAYTFKQARHADQIELGDVRLDTSTSARILSWKEAFDHWVQRPIFGFGVTGRGFIDAQFPRVLAESGIVGLVTFLYLLYAIGAVAFNSLRQAQSKYFQGLVIGFIAGFVGLLFHSIGANTFIIVRIMEPFWFFAGIITVLPMIEQEADLSQAISPQHME
ncbi:MAG: hypothetical protein GY697_28350 [Desulfobacterales bacterium]|nr:hypothetical protein [Desulfobacterales bacterium]